MPTLRNVLLAHAHSHPRTRLISGDSRCEKLPAVHYVRRVDQCKERRQRDGTDVQDTVAMNVVELKALYARSIHQGRMGSAETFRSPPDGTRARLVDLFQRPGENAAPLELRAIQGASERVQDQQLD